MITDDVSLSEVQELVRRGEVDVKETDCNGNNILHQICKLDTEKYEIVEYLISVGAAVNQVNREGLTPLIICAGKGYIKSLKTLLKNRGHIDFGGPSTLNSEYDDIYAYSSNREVRKSAILAAVENGQEECVIELIHQGADIWQKNNEGQSVITSVCMKGFSDALKVCLGKGCFELIHDPKIGKSLLLHASKNGRIECLKILLDEYGCSHDYESLGKRIVDEETETLPLLAAAAEKHEDCVLELLSRGTDIHSKTPGGQTLLMLASATGMISIVMKCLHEFEEKNITQSDSLGMTSLMYACVDKQFNCFKELLKHSSATIDNVSKSGSTALTICAKNGFTEGLKLLLQNNAKIDHVAIASSDGGYYVNELGGNSPLLLAAECKHEECVKILVDHGADIWNTNERGENLLMIACKQGLLDTVKYCLSSGSVGQVTSCDNQGCTALFHAFYSNQIKCLKEVLVSDVIKINKNAILIGRARSHWQSLLHDVCKSAIERPDIVELVVSNSTMIDIFDSRGYTPLMWCAKAGHLESLNVLIKFGASLDIVQHLPTDSILYYERERTVRDTALLIATKERHQEIAIELIDKGADILHINKNGDSVLTLAASKGLTKIVVKVLAKVTADKSLDENFLQDTNKALHIAVEEKQEVCALLIINNGGDPWWTNSEGQNVLMLAASKGLARVVKKCVSAGDTSRIGKSDCRGKNAFMRALSAANYDCAREIPSSDNQTAGEIDLLNVSLKTAVQHNDRDLIEFLVSRGASVNAEIQGHRLLTDCLECGNNQALNTLLSFGPELNYIDARAKKSPLFIAVNRATEEAVSELISHGASLSSTNESGQTLLMLAAKQGFHKIVKLCLEQYDEYLVNMVDKKGRNALMYACEGSDALCLKELLKSKKCEIEGSVDVAVNICEKSRFREGSFLLTKYTEVKERQKIQRADTDHSKEDELLYLAKKSRYKEQDVLDLLTTGLELSHTNENGQNLLMIAINSDLVNVAKYCITNATFKDLHAVDDSGKTAISLACQRQDDSFHYNRENDLKFLSLILKNEAAFCIQSKQAKTKYTDINAEIYGVNKSLMDIVCDRDEERLDLVEALLAKGASVNVYSSNGLTPLMLCAKRGHSKILGTIVRAGSDLDASNLLSGTNSQEIDKSHSLSVPAIYEAPDIHSSRSTRLGLDSHGNTPLLLAAMEGNEACAIELISHGANIWLSNSKDQNLFMLAAAKGLIKLVKYCLDGGSTDQIKARDCNNNSAVIYSCLNSQMNCLKLLLENKHCQEQVNVLSDDLDLTPLMLAVYHRCLDITNLLLKNAADPNLENKAGVTSMLIAAGKDPECFENPHYRRPTSCHSELTLLLLKHGAVVNHICKDTGESVLTVAIANGASFALVERLLSEGADMNQRLKDGKTALEIACTNKMNSVVKLLLGNCASLPNNLENCGYQKNAHPFLIRQNSTLRLLVLAGATADNLALKAPKAKEGIISNLYDMCRIPARQHVMNSFPNSNLFYMIPRLILPRKMKNFLLFDFDVHNIDSTVPHLDYTYGQDEDSDHSDGKIYSKVESYIIYAKAMKSLNHVSDL